MPPVRTNISTTLPRNFTFRDYTEENLPKTPEPVESLECRQPSPPRPAPLPRRRIRGFGSATADCERAEYLATYVPPRDVPIPTIETFFESAPSIQPQSDSFPMLDDAFLTPTQPKRPLTSPPKTPLAQTTSSSGLNSDRLDWSDARNDLASRDIVRPESAQSGFSDSSSCSDGTSNSFRSFEGSATSPESETTDPFSDRFASISRGKGRMLFAEGGTLHVAKRQRANPQTVWTDDMDRHLWTTYLVYLQDPTVTPFRVLASGIPPNGVCHRVARQAKKSWRGPKSTLKPLKEQSTDLAHSIDPLSDRSWPFSVVKRGSPDTIVDTRSGSITPTAPEVPTTRPVWSKSESDTRKRLRELCGRRASPNPARARMISPRAFTPFSQSRQPRFVSPPLPHPRKFSPDISTRDMEVSLTSSTSSTMRPNGVLAGLAQSLEKDTKSPSDDWFGQPINGTADRQIKPLDFGLGITGLNKNKGNSRLASPFHVSKRSKCEPYLSRKSSFSKIFAGQESEAVDRQASISDLLAGQSGFTSALKRRALNEPEDDSSFFSSPRRSSLEQDLFTSVTGNSHRRVRSRGFSLGDMSVENRPVKLITPPSTCDGQNSSEFAAFPTFDEGDVDVPMISPRPQRPARLGSPFAEPVTNERLLIHMNEGSSSNAFSIATFPRPHRRKYPRMLFEDNFDDSTIDSAQAFASAADKPLASVLGDSVFEPQQPPSLGEAFESEESRRKRHRE